MGIQTRLEFLDIKHFEYQATEFALTLCQNVRNAIIQKVVIPVSFKKMFPNCGVLVLSNALKKMSGCMYSGHNLHHTSHMKNGTQIYRRFNFLKLKVFF